MWYLWIIPFLLAIGYAYSISSSIKVSAKSCSSCPKQETPVSALG
jgi:hypothetical protein